jgi:hypothetical protein
VTTDRRPVIYAGGAIDHAKREASHQWRHDLEAFAPTYRVYCPLCANEDKPGLDEIVRRNEEALLTADRAVFLLDGTFTVGTPVEIYLRMQRRDPATVAIVHPDEPGVFVQMWQEMGALVVPTLRLVRPWLE